MAVAALFVSQAPRIAAADDSRTISLHHIHTGEDLTITYYRNGQYDQDALKKIDWVLRDWRREEAIHMDPQVIDALWEGERDAGVDEPIWIVCGYRAPATNAMLRARSSGVAQYSQHTLGKAIDFFIPGVPLEKLRAIGLRMQRGGVGYYPTSGSPFVHFDVGSIRHWPRMTRDQLAHVFPDGRTVHIPTDGKPMAEYSLALADLQHRGKSPSSVSLAAAHNAGAITLATAEADTPANLFTNRIVTPVSKPEPVRLAEAEKAAPAAAAAAAIVARLPQPRPAAALQVASLKPGKPSPAMKVLAALTPNDIVRTRGLWDAESDLTASTAAQEAKSAPANQAPPPWMVAREDRGPELALAYAAPAEPTAATVTPRIAAMGVGGPRLAELAAAIKRQVLKRTNTGPVLASLPSSIPTPPSVAAAPALPAAPVAEPALKSKAAAAKVGDPFDNPWMRAMMIAPSLDTFMTTSMLAAADPTGLASMIAKPDASVMMTFSENPYLGLSPTRFGGSSVVFVSTVTFTRRATAALQ